MSHNKILLLSIFFSITICDSTSSHNTGIAHNDYENWNRSSDIPLNTTSIPTVKDKVKIKVYYETLCPSSVDFFVSQLKPAVERLGSHLDIHLIPYGNAKTSRVSGRYKFKCQHGILECFGNTVHACAIDVLRNTTRAVYFNTCLMQFIPHRVHYEFFRTVFHWCGYQENINVTEIWNCVYSQRGISLLNNYGIETKALAPPYVPYLMIDGSQDYQDKARKNLVDTICQMLRPTPNECS